jgi:hypothetical protein
MATPFDISIMHGLDQHTIDLLLQRKAEQITEQEGDDDHYICRFNVYLPTTERLWHTCIDHDRSLALLYTASTCSTDTE